MPVISPESVTDANFQPTRAIWVRVNAQFVIAHLIQLGDGHDDPFAVGYLINLPACAAVPTHKFRQLFRRGETVGGFRIIARCMRRQPQRLEAFAHQPER